VIAVTANFSGFGLEFMYPDGWEVQKDEDGDWPRTVSVHSPKGAFVAYSLYLRSDAPADLIAQTVAAIKTEYEDAEAVAVTSSVPGYEARGAMEADFYCLDLLVTARTCAYDVGDFMLLTIYQGENRDFDELLLVFDAMTVSLLKNLTESNQ